MVPKRDGASDREGGVLAACGLEVDDDSDIDPVKDGVEGFAGGVGVDPEGVEEGDLAGGGGAFEEEGGGGGEEGADVGAEGEAAVRGAGVEGGDEVGEVEEVGDVLGEGEEAEGVFVDGKGGTEGLDAAAALDLGEVAGDLLFRDRLRRRRDPDRLGVVEGPAGLLEHGVEAGVHRVLRDRLTHRLRPLGLRRPAAGGHLPLRNRG